MLNKKRRAFTLIEMLIVIAIIGILATIVVFAIFGTRQKASATRAKADMAQLKNTLDMASVEGCTLLSVTPSGNGAVVSCTAPPNAAKNYITIQTPNSGGDYNLTIGAAPNNSIRCNATSDACTWSGSIMGKNPSAGGYVFTAGGFNNGTENYTCTSGGCNCDTANGCNSIP